MRIESPEITAKRGGIKYGEVPPRPPRARTIDPAPEGAGKGVWHYGLRNEDGELLTSASSYTHEPFTTHEGALGEQSWFGGVLVRAWIPSPTWEEAGS